MFDLTRTSLRCVTFERCEIPKHPETNRHVHNPINQTAIAEPRMHPSASPKPAQPMWSNVSVKWSPPVPFPGAPFFSSQLVDEVQRTDSGGSTGSSTLTTSSRTSSNAAHQHMNEKMQTIRNINRRSRGSYTSIIAANGSDEFPSPSMGRRSSVLNINPQE